MSSVTETSSSALGKQGGSSGVSLLSSGPSNFNAAGADIHSDFGTGLAYSDDGNVADPSTGKVVGTINAQVSSCPILF
jgi:hypothetical protein